MRGTRRKATVLAALVAFLAGIASPAGAYFDRVEIGARGMALGSAFGAGVEGVSAAYWNPGALSLLSHPEILVTHSRPYVVEGLAANSVVVGTRWAQGGVAATWHHLGLSGVMSEDLIGFSYGRWVYRDNRRTVDLGGTFDLAVLSFDPAATADAFHPGTPGKDFGSVAKITGDLGVLWREGSRLRFGAVWRHIGGPGFDVVAGRGGTRMPGGLELSAYYHWRPESSIYFARTDVGDHVAWNYAGEIWFYDVFAIRTGIFDEEFSGGFGVKSSRWEVDAAFLTHPSLGNTYRASLRLFLPEKGKTR